MHNTSKLEAVIFDIDDTLYLEMDYIRSGFSLLAAFLRKQGIPADTEDFVACFHTNASEAIERYLCQLGVYEEALHQKLLCMHREHIPDIRPFAHVEELLAWLKQKGLRLGVISDGTALAQNNKLIGLGLRQYFDEIVFSDALGGVHCRKPCDVSFRYIQRKMDIPFENMLYIGDNCDKDFYPVQHLGMRGIQYRNPQGVYYGKPYAVHADNYFTIQDRIMEMLEQNTPLNITIDGPVGAGKSTVAAEVARRLNILHLDTGAMYRAFAYACRELRIDTENIAQVQRAIKSTEITVDFAEGEQKTMVNGRLVNNAIRTPEISMLASTLSKLPAVREKLVAEQRKIAQSRDILLDGRDTGTNVLPAAQIKIFLTASPQVRAMRRFQQNSGGQSYEEILKDLKKRDLQDSTRAVNPLMIAEDGILVDSSELSFEQTVDHILQIVRTRYAK